MDSEAEATIARSYYKFQNGLMIMPKIIPFVKKDYKKPPFVKNPIIKVKDYVLKQWAKESFDPSLRGRINRECFLKYIKYFNEYHSVDSDSGCSCDRDCSCDETYESYDYDGNNYGGIYPANIDEYVFFE